MWLPNQTKITNRWAQFIGLVILTFVFLTLLVPGFQAFGNGLYLSLSSQSDFQTQFIQNADYQVFLPVVLKNFDGSVAPIPTSTPTGTVRSTSFLARSCAA